MTLRKKITIITLTIILSLTSIFSYRIYNNTTEPATETATPSSRTATDTSVTITFNHVDGSVVELYRGAKKNIVNPETTGSPISVENNSVHKIGNWPHVVSIQGEGIVHEKRIIYPQQASQTIRLNITKEKSLLDSILSNQHNNIVQTITSSNPRISTLYTIENITLHGDGTWATAELHYAGPDTASSDTLSIILQQRQGVWQVVAGPSITIYKSDKLLDTPESVFWSTAPKNG